MRGSDLGDVGDVGEVEKALCWMPLRIGVTPEAVYLEAGDEERLRMCAVVLQVTRRFTAATQWLHGGYTVATRWFHGGYTGSCRVGD